MDWQYTPYTLPLLISAGFSAVLALYVVRLRSTPGAAPLAALFASLSLWTLSYALEMASATWAGKMLWANLEYTCIAPVPVLWLLFALQYTGREKWGQGAYLALLAPIPLATVVLAWSSAHHEWLRAAARLVTWDGFTVFVVDEFGPWFWVHTAYSYLLLVLGTAVLLPSVFRSPHLYRRQVSAVLVGLLAPWAGNALYIFGLSPFPYLDLTPFSFIFMGLAMAWGLLRFHLLDIAPVARHTVVEGLRDAVVALDVRDHVVDLNPAAEYVLGDSADVLVGQPASQVLEGICALPENREEEIAGEIELQLGRERRVYELQLTPLHKRGGRLSGRLLVLHDITERKRAEEELVRSQRLRAVGELSLGISHNLNNMLTGILGPAQKLSKLLGEAEARRQVELILTSATRARDLVRRLGQAVRGRRETGANLHPIELAQAVREAVEGARPRWQDEARDRGLEIEVEVEVEDVPPIAADAAGLHEILLNLLFNAVDALPEGGRIEVRGQRQGDEARLQVRDTGTGMDEATRQRVYEPFFTTKAGVGTGLGLSTAYATLSSWGGRIEVESAPGRGTTFSLHLPLWRGEEAREEPEKEFGKEPETSSAPAAILLVEDETLVALVLAEALREEGHRVDAVNNGAQALARFAADRYEVAIIDLGIPGLEGDGLARRLRELDESLITVLTTGWELEEDDPRRAPFDFYLSKPYDVDQVRRLVRRVLARGRDRT